MSSSLIQFGVVLEASLRHEDSFNKIGLVYHCLFCPYARLTSRLLRISTVHALLFLARHSGYFPSRAQSCPYSRLKKLNFKQKNLGTLYKMESYTFRASKVLTDTLELLQGPLTRLEDILG